MRGVWQPPGVCPDRFFWWATLWTADTGSPWLVSRSVTHCLEENCLVFGKRNNISAEQEKRIKPHFPSVLRIYMHGTNYTARSLSYTTYSR